MRRTGTSGWAHAPGTAELYESKALIIGAGGIGGRIGMLLRAFGVEVTEVRRKPAPGVLTPDQWRARLGEFDWVIVIVPSTPDTEKMIGAAELAAMKPTAAILNFARGAVIDQPVLIDSAARQAHRRCISRRHRSRAAAAGQSAVVTR